VVSAVDAESSAERAGVRPGMLLQAIDGRPAEERYETVARAVSRTVGVATDRMLAAVTRAALFNGDPGTAVSVVLRGSDGKLLEASLARVPRGTAVTFESRRLSSGLAYLRFNRWDPPVDRRLPEAIREAADAPGLIVDLRGNRGGSFMTADYFLEPGTFTGTSTWRSGRVDKGYTHSSAVFYKGPLAVLVDEESGSASENFAALIQESGRGIVVGRPTCGCFTSSYYESVKGGGRLQWSRVLPRTRDGLKVEGEGVTPRHVVPVTLADLREGKDAALEIAMAALQASARR